MSSAAGGALGSEFAAQRHAQDPRFVRGDDCGCGYRGPSSRKRQIALSKIWKATVMNSNNVANHRPPPKKNELAVRNVYPGLPDRRKASSKMQRIIDKGRLTSTGDKVDHFFPTTQRQIKRIKNFNRQGFQASSNFAERPMLRPSRRCQARFLFPPIRKNSQRLSSARLTNQPNAQQKSHVKACLVPACRLQSIPDM